MSLRRYTWRAMQQRPGRTILTMLSIVIGVTAAVAVGLGTETTRNAYKQMFALVTGKATLEVTAKGSGVFSEKIVEDVRNVAGVKVAAPVVERAASMSFGDEKRARLQILGVDPQLDPQVRDYKIVAGRTVENGFELALDDGLAKYLGLDVGSKVRILGSGRLGGNKEHTIVGLFRIESGLSLAQLGTGLMEIKQAQAEFNSKYIPKDSIDRIQIVAADDPDKVQPRIAALLPDEVQVHRPAASTQLMRETLASSEQGLELATLFSLLMAAFIILNTFLMNVSERRRQISIMRAIGATRTQVTMALLGEALILGFLGILVGIATGFGLAYVATEIIAHSFDVQLPRLIEVMTVWPFIKGAVFGMVMAIAGAAVPGLLAGRVSPLEGMNRLVRQPSRSFTWLFFLGGCAVIVISLLVIFGSINGRLSTELASWFAVPLLIGLVMLDTSLLAPQVAMAAAVLRLVRRVEATLAQKQVLRNRMRSALTVGVLFVAGSTGVGIANSILDNVRNVHDWKDQALLGDFYVRAMMPDMATGDAPDLPEEVGEELQRVQDIKPPEGTNLFQIKVPQPGMHSDESLAAIGVSREYRDNRVAFDLISGNRDQIADQIRSGQVVVGSVLAQKLGLTAGDRLPIEGKSGTIKVPICGVANDYLVGGMGVYMQRKYAEEWVGAIGVDGYVVNADPGQYDAVKSRLEVIAKKYDVIVISQHDIGMAINRFVGGTEWSLWLLVMMGFVVAAFGMVNTLTMNVLEQTRELGLLRIVAMTKTQVRRTIMMQALIIGGIGLPPGIAIGVGIAYVLNLTMMASFGHLIHFHFYRELILATLLGGIAIVVVAAWFPARRATRINVVEALHYE